MAAPITSLLEAFARIDDPRQARGVRFPYRSILALSFLGPLARQVDMAGLQRWAEDHWRGLKGPLGFDRERPPHATTISRAPARFSLERFRDAFAGWLITLPRTAEATTVAADGKTSEQGHDAHGDPVHMLNVFAPGLGLCPAQFPVTGGKPTEPQALKAGLAELIEHYPFLRLFTGDALSCQGPLAGVILEADRDFLFAVKDDRPSPLEAIPTSFLDAEGREPDAKAVEKTAESCTHGGSGSSRGRRWPTSARRSDSPASR